MDENCTTFKDSQNLRFIKENTNEMISSVFSLMIEIVNKRGFLKNDVFEEKNWNFTKNKAFMHLKYDFLEKLGF